MTIRRNLFLLVLAAVIPVVVVGATLAIFLVEQDRRTFHRAARDRVKAISTAVDAELRGTITALLAFAASSSLQRGDLAAFHTESQAVLASQPNWLVITLLSLDGQNSSIRCAPLAPCSRGPQTQ
jgi:hypothetical protein